MGVEDIKHVLVSWPLAKEVWTQMLAWVRMPTSLPEDGVNDILHHVSTWSSN
ncbi:hypothetical protein Hanom_Chr12g01122861 [Helianthus anomalus]